jgi:hypothetical protein
MADAEEIVSSLQTAIDELESCLAAVSSAESGAEDMVTLMSSANVHDKAQEFAAAKDAIEKARNHVAGGSDLLDEAMNLVKAASG